MTGHSTMRSALTTLLCAAALLAQDTSPTAAQVAPTVGPGSRVRITSTSLGVDAETGIVQDALGGFLMIRFDRPARSALIEPEAITSLDLCIEHRRQTLKGLGVGVLVGAGLGVVLGLASGDDPPGSFIAFSAADKAGILGTLFGVGGAVAGLAIGAATWSDVWIPVPVGGGR